MLNGLMARVAVAAVCTMSLALGLGACRQTLPAPPRAIVTHADVAGSYGAEYARDDGNQVTVTYDLYDDRTFRRVTTVTRSTRRLMVRSTRNGDAPEVLSRTVVTGTWALRPGTVQLQVTGCDGDACGSEVDVGDTLELSYAVSDEGAVDLDVAPTSAPTLTRPMPALHVVMGTPETVDVSEYVAGATGYGASSSDTSRLTVGVSGSVVTLTPVSETAGSDPVVVTVTASNDAGNIDVQFSVQVVEPATEASSESAPTLTRQIPGLQAAMGTPETVELSEYIAGATGYGASSSDTSRLTVSVSGSVLTLTPVSLTSRSDPAVVTVTASNGAGELEVTFSVQVVRPVVTLDCVANDYSGRGPERSRPERSDAHGLQNVRRESRRRRSLGHEVERFEPVRR